MPDDSVLALAAALQDAHEKVRPEVEGRDPIEFDRATQFVLGAYDLATEMWFQKGDPSAPFLTNWERPWRKYGGDNPTTTYLSAPVAPVAPEHVYQLRGNIGVALDPTLSLQAHGHGM